MYNVQEYKLWSSDAGLILLAIFKCISRITALFSFIPAVCTYFPSFVILFQKNGKASPCSTREQSDLVMYVVDTQSSGFPPSVLLSFPECLLSIRQCSRHQEPNGEPVKIPILLMEINSHWGTHDQNDIREPRTPCREHKGTKR